MELNKFAPASERCTSIKGKGFRKYGVKVLYYAR